MMFVDIRHLKNCRRAKMQTAHVHYFPPSIQKCARLD